VARCACVGELQLPLPELRFKGNDDDHEGGNTATGGRVDEDGGQENSETNESDEDQSDSSEDRYSNDSRSSANSMYTFRCSYSRLLSSVNVNVNVDL